jgi:hypothetical protein
MAIDIRATVTCSLGTLISGSISDDYLQGSGLIKTRGSVEISALITPAVGTVVTFTYTKGGVTRSIPRKLRVLSSFADPFRRTTKVELGCKLSYLSDLRESLTWTAFNDPQNRDVDPADSEIVTIPIYASSIMSQCLAKLGLAASGSALTNRFSVKEFDFSAGYVSVLSDLLVSEGYFGYLDTNEILRISSLNTGGGTGPVFTSADIIDVGGIGTGQLPGEAVTVSYTTLKLKEPELAEDAEEGDEPVSGGIDPDPADPEEAAEQVIINQKINWERVETFSSPETYYIRYRADGATTNTVAKYKGIFSTIAEITYETIRFSTGTPQKFAVNDESELIVIGSVSQLPVYIFLGSTDSLTPEQQLEFETDPEVILAEAWPNADEYDYISDGLIDKWVLIGTAWTLNPPTFQERYEANPQEILNEIWPSPQIYDVVTDGDDKWIHTGSGNWYFERDLADPETLYVTKEVPVKKITYEYGPSVAVASSVATDRLTYGFGFNSKEILLSETYENFNYDKYGNQTGSVTTKYESALKICAASSLRWAEPRSAINLGYSPLTGTVLTERIVVNNETQSEYTKDTTSTYLKYVFTQNGQQELAKAVEQTDSVTESVDIIDWIVAGGLVHDKTTTTTFRKGLSTSQERPPAAERVNSEYAKGSPTIANKEASVNQPENTATSFSSAKEEEPDPNNGYRVESSSEMELAIGSATAQRRIELSMPYAPDDVFVKYGSGKYYAVPSDAKIKAAAYGRIQNRLLLGNRNGINLQVAPERLPIAPFDPLYVQADGLTALYRANGNQWAFDSNGIVCSTDALFWGAVSGTGTFWFPVAPGITTLPAEPAIVDGQMNATNVVLPYNETAIYEGRVRLGTVVTKFEYALELLTEVPALTVSISPVVERTLSIEAPSVNISIAADAPVLASSIDVRVPATPDVVVGAPVPLVGTGIGNSVAAASVSIAIAADVPFAGSYIVRVPAADIGVAAPVPQVGGQIGSAAQAPAATITVQAELPTLS